MFHSAMVAPTRETWWVYLLYALISSGSLAGAAGVLRRIGRRRNIRRQGEGYRSLSEVYMTLREVRERCHAHRSMVVVSHNCGGRPSQIRPAHVTVLYEDPAPGVKRTEKDWQEWKADGQYARLLTEIWDSDHVHLVTTEMLDGALKDHYLSDKSDHAPDGVKCSHVEKIAIGENTMFYLSINFADRTGLDAEQRNYIRAAIGHLRAVYARHPDIYEEAIPI